MEKRRQTMPNSKWVSVPLTLFVLAGIAIWAHREWTAPLPQANQPSSAADSKAGAGIPGARPVTAYYFHYTRRCETCRALEAYAKDSLESAFAEDFHKGLLVWDSVNLEDPGNGHFVNDYGLEYQSVVLVKGRDPRAWKKLDKIWKLVMNKPKFYQYVQDEYRSFRR